MKFEKLSDKKFEVFKPSEVSNPISICGGWVDTSAAANRHDRFNLTGTDPNSVDDYEETQNGSNFCQDNHTTDH